MWDESQDKLMRRVITFVFIAAIFTVLGLTAWFLNVQEFK
jgi:hypothetical protein